MNTRAESWKQRGRRLLRFAAYAGAFVLLPLAVGAGTLAKKIREVTDMRVAPRYDGALPAPPAHDPAKRTAVVLMSNRTTESTDFLAPYEVLALSGAFNVYAVAPERVLSPMFPGTLDVLPHYSFAEFERAFPREPDLIVIPYIPDAGTEDPELVRWIREHAGEQTTLLTICGGAQVLAETGLLDGRRATSHQSVLRLVRATHPQVRWISGRRFVEDGDIVSSAGVTSGLDAALHTLSRMIGRSAAEDVARKLRYPHLEYQDDPSFNLPPSRDAVLTARAAYRWSTDVIGLPLYDGIDEVELAAIIDTYPRSYSAQVYTIADERRPIRSRHGLHVVPRTTRADAPTLRRLVIPASAPISAGMVAWAERRELPIQRMEDVDFAYDVALRDMGRHEGRAVAAAAAVGLEYPFVDAERQPRWPLDILFRPFALGLLGVALVFGADRGVIRRRMRRM
jgi:putative intracellular protease/amidase